MTLRAKTLLITGITLLAIVALLLVAQRSILLDSFVQLENEFVTRNVSRAVNTLDNEISALAASARDWAFWDDTYEYAQGDLQAYETNTLLDSSFLGFRLNVVMFISPDGNVLFERGYNSDEQDGDALLRRFDAMLANRHPLFDMLNALDSIDPAQLGRAGLLMLPEGPMLVAAMPILNTQQQGPGQGMMVWARYLSPDELARLSDISGAQLSMLPVELTNVPGLRLASVSLPGNTHARVVPLEDNRVAGYALLNDITGAADIALRVETPRDIVQRGENTFHVMLFAVAAAGGVFAIVMIIMVETTVLSRLRRLANDVGIIGLHGDLNARVTAGGDDELGALAMRINETLFELQQTQVSLQEQDQFLRTLVANAPIIMFATDAEERVTFCKGRGLNILGRSPREIEGHYIYELFGHHDDLHEAMNAALRGEISRVIVHQGIHRFETRLTPSIGLGGMVNGVVGVATDVSERLRAESDLRRVNETLENRVWERTTELAVTNTHLKEEIEERQRAQEKLQFARDEALSALRTKTQLLANVSHDARTPLNAIIGFSEMLQEGLYGPITDEQNAFLTRILKNCEQLLAFINNLLDEAQIEMSTITLHVGHFKSGDLLEAVNTAMLPKATAKGLVLTTDIDPEVPDELHHDAGRIKQILLNLVENAIKFTEEGIVRVRIYRRDSAHFAIEVADTGMGIPQELQAKVFEAFFQVDGGSPRHRNSGVGLGLSIVRELAALMDGVVEIYSAVGSGSTFTVVLPLDLIPEGES